jgi:hypothetical protein
MPRMAKGSRCERAVWTRSDDSLPPGSTARLFFCALGSTNVKPVLQSLLLADKIYEDRATRKKVIAGVFNRLYFVPNIKKPEKLTTEDGREIVRVPGGLQAGSPSAYFSITDFQGRSPFILRYVDLSDSRVLLQLGMEIECKDPLETIEVVVPMPSLPVPHAGVFALELLCDNEPVGAVRINVDQAEIGGTT